MRPDLSQIKASGPTAFQQRVFDAVCRIPEGKVSTYGAVAKAINCGSSRAVGQALRRNPFSEDAPCHRVISADLSLGGFGDHDHRDLTRKRRMLEREGITFDENDRVSPKYLVTDLKRNGKPLE